MRRFKKWLLKRRIDKAIKIINKARDVTDEESSHITLDNYLLGALEWLGRAKNLTTVEDWFGSQVKEGVARVGRK